MKLGAVLLLLLPLAIPGLSIVDRSQDGAIAHSSSATVFVNANIITVNDDQPTAESLAFVQGKIVAVGTEEQVKSVLRESKLSFEQQDLQGKTVLPGFIDTHGHFGLTLSNLTQVDLQSPPAGDVKNMAGLLEKVGEWHRSNPDNEWILGYGYDDSLLTEGRHPTRYDLDAITTEKPIALTHVSGHLMSCNSKCLSLLGIDADTKNPWGGVIRRVAGSSEPNGVLEESAAFSARRKFPELTIRQKLSLMDATQQYYAGNGITTVQDGASSSKSLNLFSLASQKGLFYIDLISFPIFLHHIPALPDNLDQLRNYNNHYRIGGIKTALDGSPQGKTAWLSQPYFRPPHGQKADLSRIPAGNGEGS